MIHALVSLCLLAATPAQETLQPRVLHELSSPAAGDRFGAALADAGDLDQDGLSDLIVGSPRSAVYGDNAGNVRIYSGSDGRLLREIQGQPGSHFGSAVANPGDIDRDGFPDLLIAAPFGDAFVQLLSGKDGSLLFTFRGNSGSRFGQSVAGAGDVDGDGVLDVVIGEPQYDTIANNTGRVRVYSGADGSVLHELTGTAPFDLFGTQVAGAGDVDRDGRADFLVGAPFTDAKAFNAGGVAIFSGVTGAPLLAVYGSQMGDQLGTWLRGGSPAVDVDGDDVPDFACGIPGADIPGGPFDAGAAQIRSGTDGRLLVQAYGPEAGGFAGVVSSPMDCNGDGTGDLVLGAPSALGNLGMVSLNSGHDGSLILQLNGSQPSGWYGAALTTLSDVDGDGAPDLAIGAPGYEDDTTLVGRVYIVSFGNGVPGRRQRGSSPSVR